MQMVLASLHFQRVFNFECSNQFKLFKRFQHLCIFKGFLNLNVQMSPNCSKASSIIAWSNVGNCFLTLTQTFKPILSRVLPLAAFESPLNWLQNGYFSMILACTVSEIYDSECGINCQNFLKR